MRADAWKVSNAQGDTPLPLTPPPLPNPRTQGKQALLSYGSFTALTGLSFYAGLGGIALQVSAIYKRSALT